MSVKVSQMTVEELREVIGAVVEEKLRALFADEDDLELTGEIQARLLRQKIEVENGARGDAFEDVTARLGLN
ncbi:MAG: hypothetical protein WA584_02520 [Pyrinomonadaceae bacterium]